MLGKPKLFLPVAQKEKTEIAGYRGQMVKLKFNRFVNLPLQLPHKPGLRLFLQIVKGPKSYRPKKKPPPTVIRERTSCTAFDFLVIKKRKSRCQFPMQNKQNITYNTHTVNTPGLCVSLTLLNKCLFSSALACTTSPITRTI